MMGHPATKGVRRRETLAQVNQVRWPPEHARARPGVSCLFSRQRGRGSLHGVI